MSGVTCNTRHCDIDEFQIRQTSSNGTGAHTGTGERFELSPGDIYSWTARLDVQLWKERISSSYFIHRWGTTKYRSYASTTTSFIALALSNNSGTPGWKTNAPRNAMKILLARYGKWRLQNRVSCKMARNKPSEKWQRPLQLLPRKWPTEIVRDRNPRMTLENTKRQPVHTGHDGSLQDANEFLPTI